MKTISVLLALMALAFADIAGAASAVVTSLIGSATVQSGTAAARALRQGDEVVQGDQVATAASSSLVLKFDDGEVAALTSNSRMMINTYQYNPQAKTGSVLLSLLFGGLRAVTGLIGHNSPANVNYKAGTATIGIRGTDVAASYLPSIGLYVQVLQGMINLSSPAGSMNFAAGQFGFVGINQPPVILPNLPPAVQPINNELINLGNLINQASPGTPRQSQPPGPPGAPPPGLVGTPGGGGQGVGGGGGGASQK